MKNDRTRAVVKDDYSAALGVAAWCFAVCEWNVVWCCERIEPGALQRIVGEELTAGRIAHKFKDLVRNMPQSKEREELRTLAQGFASLVNTRNDILHGKPCTGPSGDARLYSGRVLEISDLEDAADAFANCSHGLNRLLHGFLATCS